MLEVKVFDLMNDGHDKIFDSLNRDGRGLVNYKINHYTIEDMGLFVKIHATFMQINPTWNDEVRNEQRMIEFVHSYNGANQILSQPGVRLIKLHPIPDIDNICYVVDYLIDV